MLRCRLESGFCKGRDELNARSCGEKGSLSRPVPARGSEATVKHGPGEWRLWYLVGTEYKGLPARTSAAALLAPLSTYSILSTREICSLRYPVHKPDPIRAVFHCAIVVALKVKSKLHLRDLDIILAHILLLQAACSPTSGNAQN